jgi:hypothetical protein
MFLSLILTAACAVAPQALQFSPPSGPGDSSVPSSSRIHILDIDGDQRMDRLITSATEGLLIERNLGQQQFQLIRQSLPAVDAVHVLASDLDDDSILDLYLIADGANVALRGLGGGLFQDTTESWDLVDANTGLSVERVDLDGIGGLELLLRNDGGDVIFWHAGNGFRRDAGAMPAIPSPVEDSGGPIGAPADDAGASAKPAPVPTAGGAKLALVPSGTLLPGGTLGNSPRATGAVPNVGTRGTAGPPAILSSLLDTLDDRFVNDNMNEVDSDDIVDGSLTGADISTSSGNVSFVGASLGVGTAFPLAPVHMVPANGSENMRLMLTTNNTLSASLSSELLMSEDYFGEYGTLLRYDGLLNQFEICSVYTGVTSEPHFVVERSNGNIGIGTDAPASRLHVEGDTNLVGTVTVVGQLDLEGAPIVTSDLQVLSTSGDAVAHLLPNTSVSGSSTLWFAEDDDATYAMSWHYNGLSNRMEVFGTSNQGASLSGPHMSIHRDAGGVTIGESLATDYPSLRVEQNSNGDLMQGWVENQQVFAVRNSGRVVTTALEVTGGGDIVESFNADNAAPGKVLVIDPARPGQLKLSQEAYDVRVAGVVSGAGGVRHGLALTQENVLDGDTLVALAGRVYVRCTAQGGAIEPGDLLVSSDLEGHAMRASDRDRSFGAVIGKALTPLESGEGLVLTLVGLQ